MMKLEYVKFNRFHAFFFHLFPFDWTKSVYKEENNMRFMLLFIV